MRRARLLPGLLATVAVAAAACGGSDKPAPTKGAYLKEANGVCRVANEKLTSSALKTFADGDTSEARIEKFAKDSGYPTLERLIGDLRALTPPKGDDDRVAAIYDALQDAVNKTKADPKLLTVAGENEPFKDANEKANAYGLKACGAGV